MKFTLKYRGEDLLSSGNRTSTTTERQMLRYNLHSQLRRVWNSHNELGNIDRTALQTPVRNGPDWDVARPILSGTSLSGFLFRRQVRTLWFVPMITMPMEAHCHLAIRLGRPIRPGRLLFAGGDLDGRLKTLFDALSMPTQESALPPDATGDGGEVLCLLADDSLITGLTIESHELLANGRSDDYVEIDVDVTITAMTAMPGTLALLYGG